MTFYGAAHWWTPQQCLDEAFDEPDIDADRELCCAIAAGRWGLHPDAWGNHDPLPLRWLLRKRRDPRPVAYEEGPPDLQWEAKHRRRPVEKPPPKPPKRKPGPKPKPAPPAWWTLPPLPPVLASTGTIVLTCDVCDRAFGPKLDYGHGQREAMAAGLRAMGAQSGWTYIDGRDRCLTCSPVAPKDVGNGAGERQGDKQHSNGG